MSLDTTAAGIDAPWPSQPIAWRYRDQKERHHALQAQVEAGYEFIVREVLVHSPEVFDYRPLTPKETRHTLNRADDEFKLLASVRIVPAPTEWHIFADDDNAVRVLARVAIVDGEAYAGGRNRYELPSDQLAVRNAHEERVDAYRRLTIPGRRLDDIHGIQQYMVGQLRNPELSTQYTPEPADCLIDTEPLFWLRLST